MEIFLVFLLITAFAMLRLEFSMAIISPQIVDTKGEKMSRRLVLLALTVFFPALLIAGGNRESKSDEFLIGVERMERLMTTIQPVILDVRDAASYAQGHVPGAVHVTLADLDQKAPEIAALGRTIITYCACPAEESSLAAAFKLREFGAEVLVLQGGIRAWVRERKPVVTGSRPT